MVSDITSSYGLYEGIRKRTIAFHLGNADTEVSCAEVLSRLIEEVSLRDACLARARIRRVSDPCMRPTRLCTLVDIPMQEWIDREIDRQRDR